MRVLVFGAYGLIGGYVTARLVADGHRVIGVGRDVRAARRRFPMVEWFAADLQQTSNEDWLPLFERIDAVVNCAGALQDSPRDNLSFVHLGLVESLAQACEAMGVRRLVHISAAGVDRARGAFQRTKLSADETLMATDLDWIVLRPGLVLAPSAYGGSAILRGLAAFPVIIPAVKAQSPVRIVSMDDLAEAVVRSLTIEPAQFVCDLVSPEDTRLGDILLAMRAWLGFPPARVVDLPGWLGRVSAAAADCLARIGWRTPLRTEAMRQLEMGVTGDPATAAARLGLNLHGLSKTLARWPAGVQERWFARLYFAKPLILVTLIGFWAASGIIGLIHRQAAQSLLVNSGLSARATSALVVGGCVVDLILATLACFRKTARTGLQGMILVSIAYLAGASVVAPGLWSDPLGPLVKTLPAAVLALAALAVLGER
jgi:uncharacterized protein YbjT (DUF2867 family)